MPRPHKTPAPAFPHVPPVLTGPDPIPGVVFVYGNDARGRHNGGASLSATLFYGAKKGQGEGRNGNAFGIMTVDSVHYPFGLWVVQPNIAYFIGYAEQAVRQEMPLWFLVTRVGCGDAGNTDEEIATLFFTMNAPKNCILPRVWEPIMRALPEAAFGLSDEWFSGRHWHDRNPKDDNTPHCVMGGAFVKCRHCKDTQSAPPFGHSVDALAKFLERYRRQHIACPPPSSAEETRK